MALRPAKPFAVSITLDGRTARADFAGVPTRCTSIVTARLRAGDQCWQAEYHGYIRESPPTGGPRLGMGDRVQGHVTIDPFSGGMTAPKGVLMLEA